MIEFREDCTGRFFSSGMLSVAMLQPFVIYCIGLLTKSEGLYFLLYFTITFTLLISVILICMAHSKRYFWYDN